MLQVPQHNYASVHLDNFPTLRAESKIYMGDGNDEGHSPTTSCLGSDQDLPPEVLNSKLDATPIDQSFTEAQSRRKERMNEWPEQRSRWRKKLTLAVPMRP